MKRETFHVSRFTRISAPCQPGRGNAGAGFVFDGSSVPVRRAAYTFMIVNVQVIPMIPE